jgi:hypothetical protein
VAAWKSSTIEHADVLLAYTDGRPGVLDTWYATGKPAILVIDDRANWPAAPFVLRYPFRVMQLLALLDGIAEHLRARAAPAPRDNTAWAAAEDLRRLTTQAGERGWHVAAAGEREELWIGEGHACASAAVWRGLREGALRLGPFGHHAAAAPVDAQRGAIADVAWFAGIHGRDELAPWLSADSAYRLRRWPDFGRLGGAAALLDLAAAAAARPCTPGELAARAACTVAQANRFLSAASLAGLLVAATREDSGAHASAAAPARGWMSFIHDLRRQLGWAA